MGERVQGGRLAARAIAAAGVDAIFTLSGGHVMPIYEGCRHEGVRVVDVRHEQSAAHAAEAWGRVRRATGVALVTAGPGVTGTVTAVANCFAAQTPMVVLGGARLRAPIDRALDRALCSGAGAPPARDRRTSPTAPRGTPVSLVSRYREGCDERVPPVCRDCIALRRPAVGLRAWRRRAR